MTVRVGLRRRQLTVAFDCLLGLFQGYGNLIAATSLSYHIIVVVRFPALRAGWLGSGFTSHFQSTGILKVFDRRLINDIRVLLFFCVVTHFATFAGRREFS